MCLIGPTLEGEAVGDLGLPRPQRENKMQKKTELRKKKKKYEAQNLDFSQGSFLTFCYTDKTTASRGRFRPDPL